MGKRDIDIEEQFRQAIRQSDLTRYRLSKLTGVSDGLLANFVNGRRGMTLATAARLAPVLGVELRWTDGKKVDHGESV